MVLFLRMLRLAVLLLWSGVCVFPIYWLLIASFKSPRDVFDGPFYIPFVDFQPTLEAWGYILVDARESLLWPFLNSLLAGLSATAATLFLAVLALYGMTRFPSGTGRFAISGANVMTGLLASRILPPAVLVLPFYFMAQMTGTLDHVLTLALVYTAINMPVALWLLRPVMGVRASEMEESALLAGASHLHIVFEILLPTLAKGVGAVGLFIFILCWNEYLFAVFLTSDKAMTLAPWTIGQLSTMEGQVSSEAEEWARMSAATVLMMLPALAMAITVNRVLGRLAIGR